MTHQPPFAPPPGWEYPYPPSPAPARWTIHYGFALLAFFSLLGTLIPSIVMFLAASDAATKAREFDPSSGLPEPVDGSGALTFFGVGWLLWGGMWTLVYVAFAVNHTLKERRR